MSRGGVRCASVRRAALSVRLCKRRQDGAAPAGCGSTLPTPEGLMPVLTWQRAATPAAVLLSASIGKLATLPPRGEMVGPANPAGGPGRPELSRSYVSTHAAYEDPLCCTLPLPFAPFPPHLAAYYTHGENKHFPHLIIHITFI